MTTYNNTMVCVRSKTIFVGSPPPMTRSRGASDGHKSATDAITIWQSSPRPSNGPVRRPVRQPPDPPAARRPPRPGMGPRRAVADHPRGWHHPRHLRWLDPTLAFGGGVVTRAMGLGRLA